MTSNDPALDGHYAAFGHIIDGMDVLERIEDTPVDADSVPLEPIIMKRVYVDGD